MLSFRNHNQYFFRHHRILKTKCPHGRAVSLVFLSAEGGEHELGITNPTGKLKLREVTMPVTIKPRCQPGLAREVPSELNEALCLVEIALLVL